MYRVLPLDRGQITDTVTIEITSGRTTERSPTRTAFVAPPEVAPHVAGGAVDLTLCTVDGLELPMGSEVNATPPEHGLECFTASPLIDAEARANRTTQIDAMTVTGFVNYPSEWWHWSYGDRYWAFVTSPNHARYGPAALDHAAP